jgi:hypothetical protein
MTGGFTTNVKSVMTTLASSFPDHDMAEHKARKAGRSGCVATVAGSANRDVLDRSGQSASRIILNVAASTFSGCSLENLIQMASLAAHGLVRTPEFKSGGSVVKRDACLLRMCRANRVSQRQQNGHRDPGAPHEREQIRSTQPEKTDKPTGQSFRR